MLLNLDNDYLKHFQFQELSTLNNNKKSHHVFDSVLQLNSTQERLHNKHNFFFFLNNKLFKYFVACYSIFLLFFSKSIMFH